MAETILIRLSHSFGLIPKLLNTNLLNPLGSIPSTSASCVTFAWHSMIS